MEEEYYAIGDWANPDTIRPIGVPLKSECDPLGYRRFSGSEYPIMDAFTFPKSMLQDATIIAEQRAALKKAFDDSMSLVYQFTNEKKLRERK